MILNASEHVICINASMFAHEIATVRAKVNYGGECVEDYPLVHLRLNILPSVRAGVFIT